MLYNFLKTDLSYIWEPSLDDLYNELIVSYPYTSQLRKEYSSFLLPIFSTKDYQAISTIEQSQRIEIVSWVFLESTLWVTEAESRLIQDGKIWVKPVTSLDIQTRISLIELDMLRKIFLVIREISETLFLNVCHFARSIYISGDQWSCISATFAMYNFSIFFKFSSEKIIGDSGERDWWYVLNSLIIHESCHLALYNIELDGYDIFIPEKREELIYSPVIKSPRPAALAFHALYVSVTILEVQHRIEADSRLPTWEAMLGKQSGLYSKYIKKVKYQIQQSIEDFQNHRDILTPLWNEILDELIETARSFS